DFRRFQGRAIDPVNPIPVPGQNRHSYAVPAYGRGGSDGKLSPRRYDGSARGNREPGVGLQQTYGALGPFHLTHVGGIMMVVEHVDAAGIDRGRKRKLGRD